MRFFRRPYVYAICFSLSLSMLLSWTLLSVFIIPKELEQPNEEYATIDLSQFTTAAPDPTLEPESDPIYVLTLPSDGETSPDEPSDEPSVETEPTTQAPVQYPVITENSYLDEHISITIETIRRYGSDFHVAEIKIDDPQYLKTALAKDQFGRNIKEKPSVPT